MLFIGKTFLYFCLKYLFIIGCNGVYLLFASGHWHAKSILATLCIHLTHVSFTLFFLFFPFLMIPCRNVERKKEKARMTKERKWRREKENKIINNYQNYHLYIYFSKTHTHTHIKDPRTYPHIVYISSMECVDYQRAKKLPFFRGASCDRMMMMMRTKTNL